MEDYINEAEFSADHGKMNSKKWSSDSKRTATIEQHSRKKKWYITVARKRNKWKWNKKHSLFEKTKKGSRDSYYWQD